MTPPRISVQLSQHDDALLRSIAHERGHSISFLANEMIRRSLHEDVFLEQLHNHLKPIQQRMIAIEKFMNIILSQIYDDTTKLECLLDDIYRNKAE